MKCIKNGSRVKRVDEKTASLWVSTKGWTYATKEEWKKTTRKNTDSVDVRGKSLVSDDVITVKAHGLKAKDRKKANKKKK